MFGKRPGNVVRPLAAAWIQFNMNAVILTYEM